nr:hypothetical protein Ade03nite_66480 [Actinoplanes derwentensis]
MPGGDADGELAEGAAADVPGGLGPDRVGGHRLDRHPPLPAMPYDHDVRGGLVAVHLDGCRGIVADRAVRQVQGVHPQSGLGGEPGEVGFGLRRQRVQVFLDRDGQGDVLLVHRPAQCLGQARARQIGGRRDRGQQGGRADPVTETDTLDERAESRETVPEEGQSSRGGLRVGQQIPHGRRQLGGHDAVPILPSPGA